MPLLALDTSAAISVAVLDDTGTVLGERFHDDTRQHAELLAPLIDSLLAEVGIVPAELNAIAVGTGPGPFTGLRIGLVTAETLAFALSIPVYGVCSLDALAAQAVSELDLPAGGEVIVTLDARRKEVYWARYQVTTEGLVPSISPQVTAPTVVSENRASSETGSPVIVGDGALKYQVPGAAAPRFAQAQWVGKLAQRRAASGIEQPTTPLYLRRPDIQGAPPELLPQR